MKRLIDFCLLLLMVFWGSNAWADKTKTFNVESLTSDCNLTKLSVDKGKSQSIEDGGITLQITAASDAGASWNAKPGSKHEKTIGLAPNAKITISSSSAEMKITKIVFHFDDKDKNKGYFTESSTTGGTLDPKEATSYVTTQTWSLEEGANSVSFTNNNKDKAYITSIEIIYQTGGLDNYTVQAYPYTWNFTDGSLWNKSESQFVSEIWTYNTEKGAVEWRNNAHKEPTVATGYDVDLLRGLRFTGHVCADRKNICVSLPKTATITIPSLHEGQKVKIHYTGVDILPKTNLEVSQVRTNDIEIYKVTQDGDAILTVDPNNTTDVWGAWISQISVLDVAPVLTMTSPANNATGVDPDTLTSIKVTSEKALWAYDVNGNKTSTEQTINATLTSDDEDNAMKVTATLNAGETGVKELNFTLPQNEQLESATTYTLNIPENAIMETSGTGNKNCSFTFSTKGLTYLGAYNGSKKIEANPEKVSTLDNNRVEFAFEEKLEKTADFKVIVSDGTTVNTYTKDSLECGFSVDCTRLYVPVQLKAGKYYSIKITAGSLKLKDAAAGSTLKNNQIVLHLISSMKGINLSMTTPYNQDEAPLTTRIILSAKDNDGKNTNIRNNVTATLKGESADGSQTHDIGTVTGIANGNKLVFTPKEGQQLLPNYTYTLKLTEKAELKDVKDGTLADDTFVFTTAKVIGNAPIVESTSPAAESTIPVVDVQPTTPKQIKITFNEDIQLLDGALIFCRPMGGSESYKSIEYYSARSDNPIHAEGNKLWFEYSGQNLFYGMRYEVTIPTYAIVGNGGQPMEKNIKFYFETPKSKEAYDSRAGKDVYTWDFTNISATTFTKIKESVTAGNTYWGEKNEGNDHEYGSSNAGKSSFAQGQEIKAGASNTPLPELRGLLFNLVKSNSNRFQIVCKNGSKAKGDTYLSLKGNTHYVTLQSVPAKAMVYIEHNGNEMFNRNTLGVDSLNTFTNSNGNSVSIYRLGNTTKDLTFCVQDCKLYRIAIVKDNKTIGDKNKDYIKYATYSQSYPVDYNLNKILNGTAVTAYSVSADYKSNATFVNFTELPNNQSASDEGVILTSGNLGENHPIFTTDVNTKPERLTSNALVGTTGDKATTEFDKAKKDGYQNYILTTKYFHLDKEDQVIDGNQQCFYKWVKGNVNRNFAYLQLKNPSNANAAKTVIYLDWFGDTTGIHGMTAPSQVTSGKTYYTLDGRKVTSPTQKGIYIINGKKIIIK
nr:Ig-like domain-containing protein [uncultured Prevotella sp.]